MSKKCFDDFSKNIGRSVTNEEKETLLQKVRSSKEKLKTEGKDFETTIDGDKTALQPGMGCATNIRSSSEAARSLEFWVHH